jgi:hypothetical protein
MKTRTAILIGCGSVLAVALAALIGVVVFIAYVAKEPAGLRAHVESPDQVADGETFEVRVVVVNDRADKPLTVSSIDIADEYLEGFVVRGTEPVAKQSIHVPFDNSQSFEFDSVVPPNGTNIFTFQLRARKEGFYHGDVDVCEGMRFITLLVQTEVK